MDTKVGAFWKSTSENQNAPLAKGSIDFSRIPEQDMKRIYEAFTAKGKIKVTLWRNRHDPTDKKPDLTITLDKPYNSGETSKPRSVTPDEDMPF